MSSQDSQYVPALVYAGPTPYRHVAKGKKDLYVPYHIASKCEREGLPLPREHTWRYSVSPDERHLVFFYNTATKKSVWTLPAVDEAGESRELTREETMRSEGRTLSASNLAAGATATTQASTASVTTGPPAERRQRAHETAPAAPSSASDSAVVRPPLAPKGQTVPATATVATGASDAPVSSVQRRLAAWRAKQRGEPPHDDEDKPPVASRASTEPPGESRASSIHAEPKSEAKSPPQEPSPLPERTASPSPLNETVETAEAAVPQTKPTSAKFDESEPAPSHPTPAPSAEEEELRKAELALQKEKVAALRAEALAAQQQWRARQAQAFEEDERARLLMRRRALEQSRLEQEEALARARSAALAKEEAKRAEAAQTEQVNAFLQAEASLKASESQQKEATAAFALVLAQQLQAAASAAPKDTRAARPGGVPARAPALTSEPVSTPAALSHGEKSQARITATVQYGPSFVYTGDLLYLGRVPRPEASALGLTGPHLTRSESLLANAVPDGEGTLSIGASSTTTNSNNEAEATSFFYRGGWRHGEPHGHGVLSLPNSVVEADWVDGKLGHQGSRADKTTPLQSPAQVQTRRLRGLVSFSEDAVTGPAHVELDNGALFTGYTERGHVAGRGASLLLPNGDLVEWLTPTHDTRLALQAIAEQPDTISKHTTSHPQKASTKSAKESGAPAAAAAEGSGACRLQRANGDTYVGTVKDFLPDGLGHYVFKQDGDEYRGQFSQGWMQGRGTYSFASGDVYMGELQRGVFHGRGALLRRGSFLYEGDWDNGEMHGEGTLKFADTGDIWEGTFEHNKRAHGAYTHSQWRPPHQRHTPTSSRVFKR